MKRVGAFVLVFAAVVLAQHAFADVEENFKTRPRADYSKATELSGEVDEASIETEIRAGEAASLKGIKNDAIREETMLKGDLKRLEGQEVQLNNDIVKARHEAQLAQASLAKQKLVNLEARKRVLKSLKEKAIALEQLMKINNEVAKAQAEEQQSIVDNQFEQLQIGLIEEDHQKSIEESQRLEASIAHEKQRRDKLEQLWARMKQKKKELDAKLQRSEIRAEAYAPHPNRAQRVRAQQPAAAPKTPTAQAAPPAAQVPAPDVTDHDSSGARTISSDNR